MIHLFPTCQKLMIAGTVLAVAAACSGRIEETVEYDIYRNPVDRFGRLDFLGIGQGIDLPKSAQSELGNLIKRCGQYQKVTSLGKAFKPATGEAEMVRKKLKADVEKFQDSRYVHGVLTVQLIKDKSTDRKQKRKIVFVKDGMDHSWFDSYGNAVNPRNNVYGSEEIGPITKHIPKLVRIRNQRIDLGVRYILYNKRLDKIIFDRTSYIGASLATFSKRPSIQPSSIKQELMGHLMRRIARDVCPKVASVERTLYAADDDSQADKLLQQGIELVDDGKWEQAADSWKKAILADKKNGYAYHNLGVYYERAGNLPAAMEEFLKAKRSRNISWKGGDQYDVTLNLLRPKFDIDELEPHVYGVSGAGWVSIFGGPPGSVRVGRTYSVYRAKRMMNDKYAVSGMEVVEVGRLRVMLDDPPYKLGRIVQFLEPYRIEMGDTLILK